MGYGLFVVFPCSLMMLLIGYPNYWTGLTVVVDEGLLEYDAST